LKTKNFYPVTFTAVQRSCNRRSCLSPDWNVFVSRSAHERSHMNSDQKIIGKKYPWQQDAVATEASNAMEEKLGDSGTNTPRR